MTSTYEMIKALPAKGTNWGGLRAALSRHFVKVFAAANGGAEPWPGNTTEAWSRARGVRQLRTACMEAANYAVGVVATRAVAIPASEETQAWGGFLGGETVVVREHDAEAAAVAEIAEIIRLKA